MVSFRPELEDGDDLSGDCPYYITVYDGTDEQSKRISRSSCDHNTITVSSDNVLYVEYFGNSGIPRTMLAITSTVDPMTGTIYKDGHASSSSLHLDYCNWCIIVQFNCIYGKLTN